MVTPDVRRAKKWRAGSFRYHSWPQAGVRAAVISQEAPTSQLRRLAVSMRMLNVS